MFRAPRGKVVHLLFFLICFPASPQGSQRLQLLLSLSAVNGRPPCLRTYALILWQGEEKNKNKTEEKITITTDKGLSLCSHLMLKDTQDPTSCFSSGLAALGVFLKSLWYLASCIP